MMPLFGHPDVAELKARRDIKGLVRAVGDRDETVRQDAGQAIVELRDPAALIPVLKRWKALHWEKCHEARNAFKSLAVELEGEAVPILIEALGGRNLGGEAAERLGKIGDARAIEPLCAVVADRKVRLSHPVAIEALAHFRDPRAMDALIGALSSEYSLARVCAAEALAEMGDPQAVEPLTAALEQADDQDSRRSIMQALEKLGAPVHFQVEVPPGDGLCSDDDCPCTETPIPRGTGYIYVSAEVVEFRRDAITLRQARDRLARKRDQMQASLGSTAIIGLGRLATPILVCEQGATLRKLDLEVAAADARHWWETGTVPLRPTPTAR